MIKLRPITYAQNREDIILEGFFDTDEMGTYIDIGAYDPDFDSVTKLFYDRGWTGINVEPQPNRHKLFLKKRPLDTNLNIGISVKKAKLQLRSYENQGLSTFSDEMKRSYEKTANDQTLKYEDIEVEVMPLKELFEQYNLKQVQFLKVDVEGFEYEVLASNDWTKYRPEVLCIEANHVLHDWRPLLKKHNYSLVFSDGLNEYYTDDKTNRASKFDFVEAVLFREPIVHFKLLDDFDEYDKTIAWQNDRIKTNNEQAELEKQMLLGEIRALQHNLNEITPFRRHVVKQVKHRLRKVDSKITGKLSNQNVHKPPLASVPDKSVSELIKKGHENDLKNVKLYQSISQNHPLLPVYERSKTTTHRIVRKVLKKVIKS